MLVWKQGNIKRAVCATVLCTIVMMHNGTVVVVRSKAINHLHLAVVLMSTVEAVSLFSFILRTRLAYDVSTNLER